MFSGIVSALGKIENIEKDKIWKVDILIDRINLEEFLTKENPIKLGSSILCSGICLTVNKINKNILSFDVSEETASKTNFLLWKENTIINLERSLRVGDEIGGHFVSGHVDDKIQVKNIFEMNDSKIIQFLFTKKLRKYIAEKGSVTLNGVSLTVNKVKKDYFEVNVIPFTWKNTNLCFLNNGSFVNIEVDLLSRYLLNLKRV